MGMKWLSKLKYLINKFKPYQKNADTDIARFGRIFRGGNIYGYFDWDLNRNKIDWNGGYWNHLGYNDYDMRFIASTAHHLDYVHPDDRESLIAEVRKVILECDALIITYRVLKKTGGWTWTEVHAETDRDASGWVHFISGIVLDVTQRKQAESALLRSQARHARIIKSSNDGFWEWSSETEEISFSNRCWELLGYDDPADPVYAIKDRLQAWRDRMHPDDTPAFDQALEAHIKHRKPFDVEYRIRHKDGSWVWIRGRGHMDFDEQGRPSRMSGTCMTINDFKEAEQRVIAAKEQAETASRAKSDFLSSMSHELRTPLNAILGFSQLLENDDQLDQHQRNKVVEIGKAGRYLLTLISDVLDLAKMESGHLELRAEPVQPSVLLAECLGHIKARADKKGVSLHLDLGTQSHRRVLADGARLKQIFLNLINNAVQYNRPFGQVVVSCEMANDQMLRISVRDTGYGVPQEKLKELFQPFTRIGSEYSALEGSGVGLVIARQLVNQMGGDIGFTQMLPHGSCFWIDLPTLVEKPYQEAVQMSQKAPSDLSRYGAKKILYIEDHQPNRYLLKQLFAEYSTIDFEIANNAFHGLFLARLKLPDVIVMDINLPGMDGYEALQVLRNDAVTAHIPVIALSANAMSHDRDRGLKAGFYTYLTKPLDVPLLLDALNSLWSMPGISPLKADTEAAHQLSTESIALNESG